jgi:ferrous iron transport protein A
MGSSARALTFSDLRHGQRARVVCVDPSAPASLRFQELGLVSGTEFQVVKVAPLGDPVEISLRGYRLCLRRQDAEGIQVESLD